MKIAVMVKQVADTAAKIDLKPDGSAVNYDGVQMVLNPYDEFAVEEAIKIKEAGEGEVVIFNLGPDGADEAVKTALAMGADRAVVLRDPELGQADAATRSQILAAMIGREDFDIVFCGKQATDSDTHQVGPAVAARLDMPAVTFINAFSLEGGKATVSREAEGVKETLEVTLPALFAATKGLNEPRYPSLPGIMQAARKPKEVLTLADLGLTPEAKVERLGLATPPPRAAGKIIEGELNEQVSELIRLLRDEAHAV